MVDPSRFRIQPELRLRDGRIIRSIADAIVLLREHESRPGIDDRDEVLHRLERAETDAERVEAAQAFLAWAKQLEVLVAPPEEVGRRR